MKRIWNALLYGDSETRKCLGGVILFSLLSVVLIIISGITNEFNLFILGMISAIVAIMISQTFTLVNDDYVAQVNRAGDKEAIRAYSAQKNKGHQIDKAKDTKEMQESAEVEVNGWGPDDSADEESVGEIDLELSGDMAHKVKKTIQSDFEVTDINRYAKYSRQVMKRMKRKYRMRKDHRPIMIDFSETYRIQQCPAFIWRAHNKVFLLLLEKEPRKICIPREMIHNMGYRPNVRAEKDKEYIAFQKDNLVTGVFREFLPDYYESKIKDDPLKIKNLYTIYPDICLTNRSAFQVMDLLLLNFMPQDKITQSQKINGFFKRIYAANILYKDKVYSITEYKEAVELSLKEMCYSEVPKREFVITLENLVRARLISDQYADHYMALREKIRAKESGYGESM